MGRRRGDASTESGVKAVSEQRARFGTGLASEFHTTMIWARVGGVRTFLLETEARRIERLVRDLPDLRRAEGIPCVGQTTMLDIEGAAGP